MRKAEKLRQEQESEERAGAQAEAEVTPASQEGAAAMAQVPEATDAETPGASPDRPQMSPDPPKETAAESISPPAHRSRRSERLERVNAGQSARVGSSAPSAREAEDSASTDAQDTASKSTPGRSQRDGTPSPRSEVHTRRKAQPFGLKPLESPPPEPEPAPLVDSTKVPFGLRPPDVPPSVRRAPAPSKDVPFGLKPAPSPAQEYREERRSASEAALPRPDPPQPAPVRQQADSARVRQQTDPASRPQPTTVQPAVPAEPPTPAPIASFAETLASRQIAERRQPVPGRRLLPYGVTPPPPRDPAVQYSRLEPYALEDRPSSHTQSYQQKETRSKSSTRRAIHPKDDEPSQWYNKALSEIDPDLVKATRKRWQQRGNSSQQEDSSWPGANRSPREDVWALPADAAPSNPEERRRPSKRSR
ncbi:hypothetical protein OBBRIDRAFT_68030 [Obba rivulosa]|uniref:Uncharacterized protein n=1 Tax=Obba rivulosa TaxID=1052685 RepID=A0A8E2AVA9_9APHY|nr:hypothetical protein OBBRIDRAFT_68030 [Obba rivulosa]